MAANEPAWEIIKGVENSLITRFHTGKGIFWGVNIETVRFAFKTFGVNDETRQRELLVKITAYADLIIAKEIEQHGQA